MMKSERRHELEKNILADRLGEGIQAAQPVLPFVFGAVAVVVVGFLGWGVYSATSRGKSATAWTEYYFNLTASDADSFVDVAEEFPKSKAALWAQQTAGDSYLVQGIEAIYRNRAEGEKLLNQAIDAFELASRSSESELINKAHYGLAQAHETLGQLDKAVENYEAVISSNAYPAMIEDAKQRLAFITSANGRSFYAWFDKLDPKPNVPIELPGDLSVPPTAGADGLKFDPISNGAKFDIPQSSEDNPDAPPQATEIDPSNLPDLPAEGDATTPVPPTTPDESLGLPESPAATETTTSEPSDSIEIPAADETSAGVSDQ